VSDSPLRAPEVYLADPDRRVSLSAMDMFDVCPPGRDRTCDPRLKRALLYQLSYGRIGFNLLRDFRMDHAGRINSKLNISQCRRVYMSGQVVY
jgi:hypothetical protein